MTTELARQFRRRGPWVTRFAVDGAEYGGAFRADLDDRLVAFEAAFPEARRILELGSMEGGHTVALARGPGTAPSRREVVGVEGRREHVRRARWIQSLLAVPNVRFVEADLDVVSLPALGRFDVVFCVGLLYHLARPWSLLDAVRDTAPGFFCWTHYCADRDVEAHREGMPGRWFDELDRGDRLGGLSRRAFWPTLGALTARLAGNGFDVEVLDDDPGHPDGHAVTLAARLASDRP